MKSLIRRNIPRLAIAALFAVSTATAVVATEAANPAQPGASNGLFTSSSSAADAQGYPYYRPGWHHWRGRYWEHRRWRSGYWGPYHRWHPGVWIYF